jgi:hypothetical protein
MIYFAVCRRLNAVKIGFAGTDVKDRLRNIKTACPYPVDAEAIIPGDLVVERGMHRRFAGSRMHGEWFQITPEIEDLIAANSVEPSQPYDYYRAPRFGPDYNLASQVRTEMHISQRDLAEMLGVSPQKMSSIERSLRPLSPEIRDRLQAILGKARKLRAA